MIASRDRILSYIVTDIYIFSALPISRHSAGQGSMASISDITKYLAHLTLEGVSHLNIELGNGAYGKVVTVKYRGTTYAAKEIHSILIQYANKEEREIINKDFLRECYYCSKLYHPNIVGFKGIWRRDESSFPVMVMELMEDSLTNYVKNRALDMVTKISILHDVSCGLNYLHSYTPNPIIHRDLSPNNVLLVLRDQKPIAKLSDLGVAKVVKADSRATKNVLTKAPGTVDFMPPEALVENPNYTTSLDVFSYGGIILHVVNQEWPTPSSQVQRDSLYRLLPALSEIERRQKHLDKMSGVANVLEHLVIACLDDNPNNRPAIATVLKIVKFLMVSWSSYNNCMHIVVLLLTTEVR